ncbi:MAG: ParA family protein [Deltaproteobacteria bacterium]|nr:ParA family protein [Deltaproteobacteria bacterium]
MIISLVNQKGGVGKTTLALNIGAGLTRKNLRVQFIDTDPQGNAVQWQAIEDNVAFKIMHLPRAIAREDVASARADNILLVIDTPPAIGEITLSVLMLSDLAIIPVAPSILDIWSTRSTISLVAEVKKVNPGLKEKLLVSRKIPRTRLGRNGREAIEALETEVFDSEVSQRIAYVESMIAGVSVFQHAPNSDASKEMESLCEEIIRETGLQALP